MVSYTQKQYENGQLMSDYMMTEIRTKGGGKLTAMRQKIQDYLYYAVLQGERINATNYGNCTAECGKGAFAPKCCAGVTAWGDDEQEKDFMYVCMNRSMAETDMTMSIAEFDVNIQCVESGAKKLAMIGISIIAAMISIF